MSIISMERLREMELLDVTGARLGSVKDLLLDLSAGRLRYAVVGVGHSGLVGALGIGERLIAIPYSALRLDSGQMVLQRHATALANAPSFPASQPPDFDRPYEEQMCRYWGVPPYWDADQFDVHALTAADLVEPAIPSLPATASLQEVASALVRRSADAAHVMDEQGQLLGVVTLRNVGATIGRRLESPSTSTHTSSAERQSGEKRVEEQAAAPGQAAMRLAEPSAVQARQSSSATAHGTASQQMGGTPMATSTPTKISDGAVAISHGDQPVSSDMLRAATTRLGSSAVCRQCGASNRADAGYCARCGSQLR